jgi:hypothetical protein
MKQQPGWKAVYDKLPPNDKVAFAEVNCRESRELMQKHQVRIATPPTVYRVCACARAAGEAGRLDLGLASKQSSWC